MTTLAPASTTDVLASLSLPVYNALECSGGALTAMHPVVNDGVTDCTDGLHALIAAISEAGGGRLYFPAGSYRVTSLRIENVANVALCGDAGDRAEIVVDGPGVMLLDTPTCSCVVIMNMILVGNLVWKG